MTALTPEAVGAALTKAQREAFLSADVGDVRCGHCSLIYNMDDGPLLMDAYPAHHDPDCTPDDDGGTRWSFTPLGQQVRELLSRDPAP